MHRPLEILYTGNTAAGLAPYNKVKFIYGARPDVQRGYLLGGAVKVDQRLTRVETYSVA